MLLLNMLVKSMDSQKSLQKTIGTALQKRSTKQILSGTSLRKSGTSQKPSPDSGKTFVRRKSEKVRNTNQQRRETRIDLIQTLGKRLKAKMILNLIPCMIKMANLTKLKRMKIICE